MHCHAEASLPCLPQALSGGYSAGGLVAGADGDGGLDTIRHDNGNLRDVSGKFM